MLYNGSPMIEFSNSLQRKKDRPPESNTGTKIPAPEMIKDLIQRKILQEPSPSSEIKTPGMGKEHPNS